MGMGHLPTSESDGGSDFKSLLQKLLFGTTHPVFVIVIADTQRKLNLLNDNFSLFLPGLFLLLALLILEFAVVHDFTDGRICIRRNFNQIQPFTFSNLKCVPRLYETDLLVVGSYQANLRRPNRPINTITRFSPLLTLVWPSTSINFLIPPSKLVTQLFKRLAYRS